MNPFGPTLTPHSHDWSTLYTLLILRAIRASMTSPHSRLLICDQVMNTTLGSTSLTLAPAHLPANYGYYTLQPPQGSGYDG